jgi:hypothetical protein
MFVATKVHVIQRNDIKELCDVNMDAWQEIINATRDITG